MAYPHTKFNYSSKPSTFFLHAYSQENECEDLFRSTFSHSVNFSSFFLNGGDRKKKTLLTYSYSHTVVEKEKKRKEERRREREKEREKEKKGKKERKEEKEKIHQLRAD